MPNLTPHDVNPWRQRIQLGATSVQPSRVLVVEDDVGVRTLLDIVMREHGFALWMTPYGFQLLKAHQGQNADIGFVLLDVSTPRRVRPEIPGVVHARLHCWLLAADFIGVSEKDLMESGVERITYKPFRPEEMENVLNRLVRESKGGAQVVPARIGSAST